MWTAWAADTTFPGWDLRVGWQIEDGPGFTLRLGDEGLRVSSDVDSACLAVVHCTEEHWRLMAIDLLRRVIRFTNQRLDSTRRDLQAFAERRAAGYNIAALSRFPGVVELEFTDDAGDTGSYRCVFGSGQGPRARLLAGDADVWALLTCEGKFVRLLKSRMQLDGDAGYLVRLAGFFERGG